jgi:hypothetical protein
VCFRIRMDRLAAVELVGRLELDVMNAGVCLPCLTYVAFPLDLGRLQEARREARELAPTLWDEGLESGVVIALETAKRERTEGAAAALNDIARSGGRSVVVEEVVWRLAQQLVDDMRSRRPDSKVLPS